MKAKETDATTTLLGAALHYNDDLKKEVEDWIRALVYTELHAQLNSGLSFERTHINNFSTFRRLVHEVLKQDLDALRKSSY